MGSRHYTKAFRQSAVERMKSCENITALAVELGVSRRQLYKWRDWLEPAEPGEGSPPPDNDREMKLREENRRLKQALADKALEVDFFKGALQKIGARRQRSRNSGETASTTRSGQ